MKNVFDELRAQHANAPVPPLIFLCSHCRGPRHLYGRCPQEGEPYADIALDCPPAMLSHKIDQAVIRLR